MKYIFAPTSLFCLLQGLDGWVGGRVEVYTKTNFLCPEVMSLSSTRTGIHAQTLSHFLSFSQSHIFEAVVEG